ncbi:MAG: ABC transporter ATP-binding protein [Candidatus Dadabacteria bacterium]|nr:MAG: ABC transporter ATP-binding protein [Candidatus Dadabacteria bacterium]
MNTEDNKKLPILSVQSLHFSIGGTSILNGIECRIFEGETVGVIGPNGSGKTTFFNCLSGFCMPDAGEILFKGTKITDMPPHKRARLGIGRVFQNFGVFKEMTVIENVIVAIESREALWRSFFPWGTQNKRNRSEAYDFLEKVGLHEKAEEKTSSLSGGQMRLLEIIRALAFGADLFLLDEPTAGVSPKMKDDVAKLIRLLQEEDKTIMVIEHDLNFIEGFCERIMVIDVGRIVLDGEPDKVRRDPLLQKIYFGKDANEKTL